MKHIVVLMMENRSFDHMLGALHAVNPETTSLKRVYFWGLGNDTLPASRTAFGFEETVVGTKAIVPFAGRAGVGILAEFNGRFPSVRAGDSTNDPFDGRGLR